MVVRSRRGVASLVAIVLFSACQGYGSSEGRLFSGSRGGGTSPRESSGSEQHVRTGAYASERTSQHERTRVSYPVRISNVSLPEGRDIAALSPDDCMHLLDRAAVQFELVPEDDAPAVATPLYVREPLYGVSFGPKSGDAENGMLDCRLALALYAWAPTLREAGIVKVEHYSTYRPGARVRGHGKSSGHAHALAIDAARFHLADGRVLDVDADWQDRERGGSPCPVRDDEGEDSKLLRNVVCEAVDRDLFQVVLTPHFDRAHQNHVHLELVPDVDWSYVR